ncbi:hypothetical protein BX600DRAFT_442084 [Xylariales sp. PMI_506]|nr:hypothetical protein BX600DRAFT_442084 [Xylariales sp. PMI_506]
MLASQLLYVLVLGDAVMAAPLNNSPIGSTNVWGVVATVQRDESPDLWDVAKVMTAESDASPAIWDITNIADGFSTKSHLPHTLLPSTDIKKVLRELPVQGRAWYL